MSTYCAWSLDGMNPYRTRALVALVARVYGRHPRMRAHVARVLDAAGAPPHNNVAAALAIFEWVRDNIRFLLEQGEQVLTPGRVLQWGFGDCDDRSGLVCAMLESIRIPWRLMLLARKLDDGRLRPYHIWPQALVAGQWVNLETSDRAALFGEHPTALTRKVRGIRIR